MELIQTTIDNQFMQLVNETKKQKKLFYKEQSFSWEEISHIADKMAMEMLRLDVPKGSHIAVWCANSPLYVCAFFAIARIGCVSVLINPSYTTWEMNHLVDYADLKGIFCDERTIKKIQKIKDVDFLAYIGEDAMADFRQSESFSDALETKMQERKASICPQDSACMLFTSGTTGGAKGVKLTHFQLLNVALRATAAMHWQCNDSVCLSLPLFHSFGLSTGVLAALFHKGSVCMTDGFKSRTVMQCVERHQCTVLNAVPTIFLSILYNPDRHQYHLNSLNSGIIAGSGVYEKDFLNISKELEIPHLMQSYGQTEASPSITFSDFDEPVEQRARSVGKTLEDIKIRIWDHQTGMETPPGNPGEIEIQGFNVMNGYYQRPSETAKVLSGDGWMKTGDIGYLDERGNLHILGRMKDMIIHGGENISPQEVEEVILNMKGIRQVKVFGIEEAVIQENIVACIETDVKYTVEEVRHFVKRYLADYKVPKYIVFFSKLPENASGKIDVQQLKRMILNSWETISKSF